MRRLPEIPDEAVAEYWQLVRAALVAGGLSKKDAAVAAKAYREYMKPAGWAIYNRDPEDAAEYAIKYAAWMREEQAAASNGKVSKRAKQPAKNANTLPTEEEIAQLPRWARVAFAARCARRVLPLFQHQWPDAPKEHVLGVKRAVDTTEQSATGATAAVYAEVAYADSVYAAIDAAADTANAAFDEATDAATTDAVSFAVDTAAHTFDAVGRWVIPIVRQDCEQVLNQNRLRHWTDATPVPPSVFGPLWPEGPPQDWPELPKPTLLKLTVQVPDGMDDAAVCEKLKTLTAALGRLNIAGGGHGLKLVPPVEFTEDQVRGLADVVREEEGQKSQGGRHPGR